MLINCVVYQEGKKLADIASRTSATTCDARIASSGWRCATPPTRSWPRCSEEFGLHELAVEDARSGPPAAQDRGVRRLVFAVMHTVELDATDELHVGEVDVFVGRNYVLSVRHRTTQRLPGVRERAEREPELLSHGAGFVLYALMDAVVDRYFPVIDALETELEAIEEQIFERGAARANFDGCMR